MFFESSKGAAPTAKLSLNTDAHLRHWRAVRSRPV